ncbi:1-deoxy-D-xylulose-5-phosphate reductoisomerase [Phreatobacter aquaticus]|uniref:1-deoxy-D-xylulose 5-phosphate reductoisomerase n=1 Tax=Phreatobacter aquaticus TaxID=2570229 RepID=A0A4D7QPI9_9HYPH|nr:1-deoxy-D-xylulose-5-phosphate reductoisomerase [Phreatobacter aquaticus]QCK87506.1 1-deoxy-D-xylulose-5-phosphate reductoisomerase [Phreatobacter aquaticus]
MRSLTILGATGSVGTSTLDLVSRHRDRFTVEAVTAHSDAAGLARVAREHGARFAAIANPQAYHALKAALAGSGIEAAAGPDAVVAAAERSADMVLAAISGSAGVAPVLAAIRRGITVALANKESLVAAGDLVMSEAARHGVRILPVDSEHNAVFQALAGSRIEDVETVWLTASGGPFRTWNAEAIAAATPQDALKHPNYAMGAKVTIDSASLMNKGLELIEAHHLFAMPADRLKVLVHPQQAVHGMVGYRDGSVVAQLGAADMRVPIAHCLGFPERIDGPSRRLDLAALGSLTFEEPDLVRFPALRLAIDAMRAGGRAPCVLNAANEVAVEAFLARRIGFGDIARTVAETLDALGTGPSAATLEDLNFIDHVARERATSTMHRAVSAAS